MKIKLIILSFLMTLGMNAQEKPVDKITETKTRIINVMEDGKMVQRKVMVRTTKEQIVKTDPAYKGTIDAPRVLPPKEVTKVIYIDNDYDPFYDSKTKIEYIKDDGVRYSFNPTNFGFNIIEVDTDKVLGTAKFSIYSDIYLLDTENYNGIGYFKNNKFVVEYYDEDGTLVVEKFKDSEL